MCDGARPRVIAKNNPCLIHLGQDWSDTDACERKMYLEDVEPVLREGMDFLRDEGISIGCYANRYTVCWIKTVRRRKNHTDRAGGGAWPRLNAGRNRI